MLEYGAQSTEAVESLKGKLLAKTCRAKRNPTEAPTPLSCLNALRKEEEALERMSEYITHTLYDLYYLLEALDVLPKKYHEKIEHETCKATQHSAPEIVVQEKVSLWRDRLVNDAIGPRKKAQAEYDHHHLIVRELGIISPPDTKEYLRSVYEAMKEEQFLGAYFSTEEPFTRSTEALLANESAQKKRGEQLLSKKLSDVMYKEFALRKAVEKTKNTLPNCSLWNKMLPEVNWNFFLWVALSPFILFMVKVARVMVLGSRTRRQREAFRKAWTRRYNGGRVEIN